MAGVAIGPELVLVGDHVDDRSSQAPQLRRFTDGGARALDLDDAFGREEAKGERRARAFVADERERKLVDGDAEILEIADGQTGPRAGVGGGQPGEPEVHRMAGNRECDRSVV